MTDPTDYDWRGGTQGWLDRAAEIKERESRIHAAKEKVVEAAKDVIYTAWKKADESHIRCSYASVMQLSEAVRELEEVSK